MALDQGTGAAVGALGAADGSSLCRKGYGGVSLPGLPPPGGVLLL